MSTVYTVTFIFLYFATQVYNHQIFLRNSTSLKEICRNDLLEINDVTVLIRNWTNLSLYSSKIYHLNNIISLFGIQSENLEYYTMKEKRYKVDAMDIVKPQPALKFILENIHLRSLKLALYKLRDSVWWNMYGYYFIDNTQVINSCSTANQVLKLIWDFDILFAIFMCCDHNYTTLVYTFNPFTNYAPNFWMQIESSKQENGHPFILYKLKSNLNDLSVSCQDLFFEKTQKLGGFPIKMMYRLSKKENISFKITSKYEIEGIPGTLYHIALSKINATPHLTILRGAMESSIDDEGIPHGVFKYFFEGNFDLLIERLLEQEFDWKNQIYSNTQTNLCYITRMKLQSLKERVQNLISVPVLLFLIFSIIITTTFGHYMKISVFGILLDVIRVLSKVATLYQPHSKSAKLIFISLIFIFMFLNFHFESNLTSDLSVIHYKSFINTKDDLARLNFTVYAHPAQIVYFSNTELENNIKPTHDVKKCVYVFMQEMNKIACLSDCFKAYDFLNESNDLHVGADPSFTYQYVFLIRDNFSLHKKIVSIIDSLHEAGIDWYISKYIAKIYSEKQNHTLKIEMITLKHMTFVFIFLGCGLALSCLVFSAEITSKCCAKVIVQ